MTHCTGYESVETRHPNMIIVRDYTANINKGPMLQLKQTYKSHKRDKLSFQSAYTLFKQAYYATAKHPIDKQVNTHYALTTQIAAQDKKPVAVEHGDIDELCAFVDFFACSRTYHALWLALDPAGQQEFSHFYFARVLSYLADIPMVNARLLKEWYDAGRVTEKSGMTKLSYDEDNREFVCTFNDGSEKRSRYVVNATGFGRDITQHYAEHPLLADLVQSGTIEITQHGGVVVNEHNHVQAPDHGTIDNLAAVGPGVYKGRPSGEASYFISEKAENAARAHFRNKC